MICYFCYSSELHALVIYSQSVTSTCQVITPYEEDPNNPGMPLTKNPYHVRVLVPCYKESLEILRRTVMAAYDAVLPEGCSRTIYLLDDGKDPKKRKWVDSLGADVVYVSGRKRPAGEMNGKSGNLNNAISQVYPRGTQVPGNELVCIFDADQVWRLDGLTIPTNRIQHHILMLACYHTRWPAGNSSSRRCRSLTAATTWAWCCRPSAFTTSTCTLTFSTTQMCTSGSTCSPATMPWASFPARAPTSWCVETYYLKGKCSRNIIQSQCTLHCRFALMHCWRSAAPPHGR